MAPCLPERAARSSARAPHHLKCGYTAGGSWVGGQDGEQDFSLQHLSAFLSKPPVPRSLSLSGGTWWLLKFLFGLGGEGRSRNL